jgi:predicted DNA-binding transcriptional regulator
MCKMSIQEIIYVEKNMPKLPIDANVKILLKHKKSLDEHGALIEKSGIGNYLFTRKVPHEIIRDIKCMIENYLDKNSKNM